MAHDRTRVLGVLGYRRMSEDVGASIRTSCWAAHVHCLSPIIWPVVINGAASECHNVERPVTRVLGKPASRSGSTRFLYTPPSCSSPPSEAEAAPRRFVTAVVGVGVPVESVAGAAMVGGAGRGGAVLFVFLFRLAPLFAAFVLPLRAPFLRRLPFLRKFTWTNGNGTLQSSVDCNY